MLPRPKTRFARFALLTLAFTVIVILWGAFVRATGSGAGCGDHWPLCNGVVFPRAPRLETLIEMSHRLSSGVSLILVFGMVVAAYRRYPKGHAARHGATLAGIFLVIEAAIGAGIVLLKLVAHDDSILRAVSVSLHLFNTFILLSCLTYVAWYALIGRSDRFVIRASATRTAMFGTGLALLALVGVAGAIVALGDTLFPSTSLAEGLRQDLSPTAHFLIRLRVVHPLLAVATAGYLALTATIARLKDPRPRTAYLANLVVILVGVQLALGTFNLALLAPVWLQLGHLLVADLTWIAVVVLALHSLADAEPVTRVAELAGAAV